MKEEKALLSFENISEFIKTWPLPLDVPVDETEEYWVFKNGPRQLADGNNFPKSKVIIKLKKVAK